MKEDTEKLVIEKYGRAYTNALKFTMNAEGLFANHSDDKGGMTYQGIARVYNGRWEGWKIIDKYLQQFPELSTPFRKPPVSVERLNKILSEDTTLGMLVFDYYYANYFVKSGADMVSKTCEKAGIIIFDISVISGKNRSSKTVQRLLNRYYGANLVVDGILGSITYKAFEDACNKGQEVLVNHLLLEYLDNLNESAKLANNKVFLAGWIQRVTNLRNYLRLLK